MKVISIWQPFATLIVEGHKVNETRTWPVPKSLIGQTIGIASTKRVLPDQRAYFETQEFQKYYSRLGYPETIEELPLGHLLGTAHVVGASQIDEDLIDDTTDEELAYGWYNLGGWAWHLSRPMKLDFPIPIKGKQGLYDWHGELPNEQTQSGREDQTRPADIRANLRVV